MSALLAIPIDKTPDMIDISRTTKTSGLLAGDIGPMSGAVIAGDFDIKIFEMA